MGAPRHGGALFLGPNVDSVNPVNIKTVDCVIQARWVIPVEPGPAVLADHSVVLKDGRIEAVLPSAEATLRYEAQRRVSLPQHVLIPGLVNLHTHAAMSLMRGLADDLPLMKWLKGTIWPAEAKHVSPGLRV